MECDYGEACKLLLGLDNVEVVAVDDQPGEPLRIHIAVRSARPDCEGCGKVLSSKDIRRVELVDMTAFGRSVRLVWYKYRWFCEQKYCDVKTVTQRAPHVAPSRSLLTTRAVRWVTYHASQGRSIAGLAKELGCTWYPINTAVQRGRQSLGADTRTDTREEQEVALLAE